MRTVTAARMQRADRLSAEKYGIPVLLLMENAGRAVADAAEHVLKKKPRKTAIILCGSGNNGGDGIAAARTLYNRGYPVIVWWLKNPLLWKGSRALHYQIAHRSGVRFVAFDSLSPASRAQRLREAGVIIDALLGTGVFGEIGGPYRQAIKELNAATAPVIAVDIPSGLDANSGQPLGLCVQADTTVTLAAVKKGMLKKSARPFVGRMILADIGIPRQLL